MGLAIKAALEEGVSGVVRTSNVKGGKRLLAVTGATRVEVIHVDAQRSMPERIRAALTEQPRPGCDVRAWIESRYFDNAVSSTTLTDATLECREATGSRRARLVGLRSCQSGRVAGDRPEIFIGSGITTPSATVSRCYRSIGRRPLSCTFEPIRGDDGELRVDHFLPDTESGRALAASVRSGETPGLSVEFHALAEGIVSGVREIRQSLVTAVAVVPSGSYDQSRAEVRSKAQRVAWWRR